MTAGKAKLVIGIFGREPELIEKAKGKLEEKFGGIDFQSPLLSFGKTDYYRQEMGDNLRRRFYAFKELIPPEQLAQIKVWTNKLEQTLALKPGRRRINIDPGYVSLAKVVLATTKNYSHRLYLNQGIYAEVTLSYRDENFQSWPWTYPEYRQKEYIEIFNQIRKIYKETIQKKVDGLAGKEIKF